MASLSKKGHRPSRTFDGGQEHTSNAKKNCQECLEGERPSELFVVEGGRHNELNDGNGKRPNSSFGGGKKRYSALFVHEGKGYNTTREGERKHRCNVENGRAE